MEPMSQDDARIRVKELEKVVQFRPTSIVLADLAGCYFTLGDTEKALPFAQQAWAKNRRAEIGGNLALILKDLGRYDEAFVAIEEAYWLKPEDDYIRLGYGEALLRKGFWEQGWKLYDGARPTQQLAAMDLCLPSRIREWQGQPLPDGHKLLVINEGGTGDRFHYARWLLELSRRRINWIFYPYDELFSFFTRIFPLEKLVADKTDILPEPTHWTTTFSLPAKLNASPGCIPPPLVVTARPESIEKYKIQRTDNLPVVGICYEAAEKFQGGRRIRSMTEGQAMRLVCMTGHKIHWVNLQYGKKMPLPVTNVTLQSWEDTAGLLANLDGVVTVDTGVMHLAGAMGKPMKTILPGNSCWKFLQHPTKCPMYPTARLYRNKGLGFENAIDSVVADLLSKPL